jgi:hypothetical protein
MKTENVVQVVEHPSSKHKALSSNPGTAKRKNIDKEKTISLLWQKVYSELAIVMKSRGKGKKVSSSRSAWKT